MAKRPPAEPARTIPDDDSMRERGFAPFLRPDHLASTGEWFKLTGYNILATDKSGPYAKVELRNERGQDFVIGVREGTPDHRQFFHAFGTMDHRAWNRGAVKVKLVTGKDQRFVNVEEIDLDGPVWGA